MSNYLTRRERLSYWLKARLMRVLILVWMILTGQRF